MHSQIPCKRICPTAKKTHIQGQQKQTRSAETNYHISVCLKPFSEYETRFEFNEVFLGDHPYQYGLVSNVSDTASVSIIRNWWLAWLHALGCPNTPPNLCFCPQLSQQYVLWQPRAYSVGIHTGWFTWRRPQINNYKSPNNLPTILNYGKYIPW
jgi:hypothetical protein